MLPGALVLLVTALLLQFQNATTAGHLALTSALTLSSLTACRMNQVQVESPQGTCELLWWHQQHNRQHAFFAAACSSIICAFARLCWA